MKRFLSILAVIPLLAVMIVYAGPPIVQGINLSSMGAIGASSVTVSDLTASKPVFTDGSKVLVSTGTLGVDQGGTGATSLTDGGILLGSGTGAVTALGVASNGQIPIGDGTTDPVLATITGTADEITVTNGAGTITLSIPNPLIVGKGGTGATSLTDGGILLGSGTGAITALGVASNGQIPIGDGTTDPVLATITGTANQVVVTNGAGTITLSTPQSIATSSAVQFGSVNINALLYWGSATAEADEGSITLPTITANYSGHGFVRVSSAGIIQDSAEFESGSDGNVSLIRGTANVVVGAACANAKICISTAAAQNPIIVQSRNGAAQVEIEFWYK